MGFPTSVIKEASKSIKPNLPSNWEDVLPEELAKIVGELLDRRGFRRWMADEMRSGFTREVITRLFFDSASNGHGRNER